MSVRYVFVLSCNLRENMPAQVIDTLKYMTRTEDYEFNNPPAYDLFKGNSWRDMLRVSPEHQNMPNFSGDMYTSFRRDVKYVQMGIPHYFWTLQTLQFTMDDGLIGCICLAAWLAQYCERFGLVGYYHSHEDIEYGYKPYFLYAADGKLQVVHGHTNKVFTVSDECQNQELE